MQMTEILSQQVLDSDLAKNLKNLLKSQKTEKYIIANRIQIYLQFDEFFTNSK